MLSAYYTAHATIDWGLLFKLFYSLGSDPLFLLNFKRMRNSTVLHRHLQAMTRLIWEYYFQNFLCVWNDKYNLKKRVPIKWWTVQPTLVYLRNAPDCFLFFYSPFAFIHILFTALLWFIYYCNPGDSEHLSWFHLSFIIRSTFILW